MVGNVCGLNCHNIKEKIDTNFIFNKICKPIETRIINFISKDIENNGINFLDAIGLFRREDFTIRSIINNFDRFKSDYKNGVKKANIFYAILERFKKDLRKCCIRLPSNKDEELYEKLKDKNINLLRFITDLNYANNKSVINYANKKSKFDEGLSDDCKKKFGFYHKIINKAMRQTMISEMRLDVLEMSNGELINEIEERGAAEKIESWEDNKKLAEILQIERLSANEKKEKFDNVYYNFDNFSGHYKL